MNATEIFEIAHLIAGLVETGATTTERIRAILQQEGATPAQLQAMDDRLSAAIARREAEAGGKP